MKAINNIKKYPKFLKANDVAPRQVWNKHLSKPWTVGEIVKVAPEEDQHSSPLVGTPTSIWRSKYVKVIRKDNEGKWSIVNVNEWNTFELLTKK